jgi:hypothetical protein
MLNRRTFIPPGYKLQIYFETEAIPTKICFWNWLLAPVMHAAAPLYCVCVPARVQASANTRTQLNDIIKRSARLNTRL